ncbi:MAG: hypothetical protein ACKOCR_03955, partial [Burkholderiaceae bacterium]
MHRTVSPSRFLGLSLLIFSLCLLLPVDSAAQSEARLRPIPFSELPGWPEDDLKGFSAALNTNCSAMRA